MNHIYISSCVPDGGIFHYTFENGVLTQQDFTPLDSPMYTIIRDGKLHVILREADRQTGFGGYLSFELDGSGKPINPSAVVSTEGVVPCHLDVWEDQAYVVNYVSGNLTKIGGTVVQHTGKGVDPDRQEGPHTHYVTLTEGGKYVLCTDLGLDTIFVYDPDLKLLDKVRVPDGSGPRHLCFSKDGQYVYCVDELSNDVHAFSFRDGKLVLCNTVSAVPDYQGETYASAIRVRGDSLYVANRGADTISWFRVAGEKLELLGDTPCGGHWPRDFVLSGEYILCCNERGNRVNILKLESGKPVLTDRYVEMAAPLCVTAM